MKLEFYCYVYETCCKRKAAAKNKIRKPVKKTQKTLEWG